MGLDIVLPLVAAQVGCLPARDDCSFAASNFAKKNKKSSHALGGVCNVAFLFSCFTTGEAAQNYGNTTKYIYLIIKYLCGVLVVFSC
jgi:hypothetical protein